MKKDVVIFDFDGTVMDGSVCIMRALEKTCRSHGIPMPEAENLRGFIGPPIWTSMRRAGFSDEQIPSLLDSYRVFCREPDCISQFRFYDGMENLLTGLRNMGCVTMIISMRTQHSLEDIEKAVPYFRFFDVVYGRQGDSDTEIKSELISRVLNDRGYSADRCILVGDSEFDEEGALNSGMDFAGVLYGFGFKDASEVKSGKYICSGVEELSAVLSKLCE